MLVDHIVELKNCRNERNGLVRSDRAGPKTEKGRLQLFAMRDDGFRRPARPAGARSRPIVGRIRRRLGRAAPDMRRSFRALRRAGRFALRLRRRQIGRVCGNPPVLFGIFGQKRLVHLRRTAGDGRQDLHGTDRGCRDRSAPPFVRRNGIRIRTDGMRAAEPEAKPCRGIAFTELRSLPWKGAIRRTAKESGNTDRRSRVPRPGASRAVSLFGASAPPQIFLGRSLPETGRRDRSLSGRIRSGKCVGDLSRRAACRSRFGGSSSGPGRHAVRLDGLRVVMVSSTRCEGFGPMIGGSGIRGLKKRCFAPTVCCPAGPDDSQELRIGNIRSGRGTYFRCTPDKRFISGFEWENGRSGDPLAEGLSSPDERIFTGNVS